MCAATFPASSKRAKDIVALSARNDCNDKPVLSPLQNICLVTTGVRVQETSPISPISSWWDNVFEAGDIPFKKTCPGSVNVASVKRKLVFDSALTISSTPDPVLVCGEKPKIQTEDIYSGTKIGGSILSSIFCVSSSSIEGKDIKIKGLGSEVLKSSENIQVNEKISQDPSEVSKSSENIQVSEKISQDQSEVSKSSENIQVYEKMSQDQSSLYQVSFVSIPQENLFPSQLKILEAKIALNSGLEHVNTVGKVRKARKLLKPCKDTCNRCAKPKLDNNERELISKSFWSLKDHAQQWLFIHSAIKLSATKRRIGLKGKGSEKVFNRDYSFTINIELRKVCKTMFKTTLNISDSWIVSALPHCSDNHLLIPDQRGKHRSLLNSSSSKAAGF